ncbi:MAG TPA: hypothetical protein ENI11_05100 [Actinobacteria bacterium]|nr:hypothetical protein [Actinomycetota bacterium]
MSLREKIAVIMVALAVMMSFGISGQGHAESSGRRAVLVVIDRTSWAELADINPSNLKSLADRGAIGLLVNHSAKIQTTSARSYLTIGAGSRADVEKDQGRPISKTRFNDLVKLNEKTGYEAVVGRLSTGLSRKDIRVAVIGNADSFDAKGRHVFGREAELIGIDEAGHLPPGPRSESVLSSRPSRLTEKSTNVKATDYSKLKRAFKEFSKPKTLVVVETGDTRRADSLLSISGHDSSLAGKKEAILKVDKFIGWVAKGMDFKKDLLIVVSPTLPLAADSKPDEGLVPIIMAGPGLDKGLLTSPSTRRSTLVVSLDIAPTIANYFGVNLSADTTGRLIRSEAGRATFSIMAREAQEYSLSERLSVPVIIAYSAIEILLIVGGVLALVIFKARVAKVFPLLRFLSLFVLALPLGIFLGPLVPISFAGGAAYIGVILVLALTLAFIAWRFSEKTLAPLIFLTALTAAFVAVNLFIGAPGDGKSALGYTAISAGRFYGLGNHYLSILVPAFLVMIFLWIEKTGRDMKSSAPLVAGLCAFVVFIVGFGGLGANTGGIIMIVPAFTLIYFAMVTSLRARHFGLALINTLVALAILAGADALFPSEPTHLGIATRQAYSGAASSFLVIIQRKVMLNVGVFRYSYWSYVFIAVFASLIVWKLFWKKQGREWALKRHPGAAIILFSGTIAGLVGTLANDSGIAIMAMLLGYLLVVVFYLEICDRFA